MKSFLLAIMVPFMLALSGCVADQGVEAITDTLVIAGSTTVTPLMRVLQETYMNATTTHIDIQEIGTSGGINATLDGISDIAMASRSLTADEQARGLNPVPIAMDGVAVIVHHTNPVDNLTLTQIEGIFRGEIRNWSEVGGHDAPITVVSRELGSGMRTTFESFSNVRETFYINGHDVWISAVYPHALVSSGTGGVLNAVSGNTNAIGYLTTGIENPLIRPVAINGVRFSVETAQDGTYPFANVFYLGLMSDPSPASTAFVQWILSEEGQQTVADAEFVPIN